MDDKEERTQLIIQTLANQRNAAMNHVVELEVEITILKKKLDVYSKKVKKIE
jgi:hypothetical protein